MASGGSNKILHQSFLLLTNFEYCSCSSRFLFLYNNNNQDKLFTLVRRFSLSRFIANGCSCSLFFLSPFRSAHFIISAFLSTSFSTLVFVRHEHIPSLLLLSRHSANVFHYSTFSIQARYWRTPALLNSAKIGILHDFLYIKIENEMDRKYNPNSLHFL